MLWILLTNWSLRWDSRAAGGRNSRNGSGRRSLDLAVRDLGDGLDDRVRGLGNGLDANGGEDSEGE